MSSQVRTYDQDVDGDENEDGSGSDSDSDSASRLVLVFTCTGQAVLEEDDEPVWFSDDDEDFREEFGTEFLSEDDDATKILNWLEEEGFLDPEEKPEVEIETEIDENDENDK